MRTHLRSLSLTRSGTWRRPVFVRKGRISVSELGSATLKRRMRLVEKSICTMWLAKKSAPSNPSMEEWQDLERAERSVAKYFFGNETPPRVASKRLGQ